MLPSLHHEKLCLHPTSSFREELHAYNRNQFCKRFNDLAASMVVETGKKVLNICSFSAASAFTMETLECFVCAEHSVRLNIIIARCQLLSLLSVCSGGFSVEGEMNKFKFLIAQELFALRLCYRKTKKRRKKFPKPKALETMFRHAWFSLMKQTLWGLAKRVLFSSTVATWRRSSAFCVREKQKFHNTTIVKWALAAFFFLYFSSTHSRLWL